MTIGTGRVRLLGWTEERRSRFRARAVRTQGGFCMTQRVLGPTGSRRRRRFLIVPMLLVAATALLLVGAAQAVHDETFQLDGNIAAGPPTNLSGNSQAFDWESFFDAAGQEAPVLPDASRPGYTASGFDRDFTLNGTTFS